VAGSLLPFSALLFLENCKAVGNGWLVQPAVINMGIKRFNGLPIEL
jgi:hypothetical protein